MAIFFTSDSHFSHKNTMKYCGRPFWTTAQCDEAMIERWNSVVGPEDTVYHLGDVAMHTSPIERILPRLNGKKILIVGNHDLMFDWFIKTRGQKFVDKMKDKYLKAGFSSIYPGGKTYTFPVKSDTGALLDFLVARLSHFPTKNVTDSRYAQKHEAHRPIDDGTLNICGHVHTLFLKKGNNINVGVDVWDFYPVSLETIYRFSKCSGNLENPYKLRIALWKIFHYTTWKVRTTKDYLTKLVFSSNIS